MVALFFRMWNRVRGRKYVEFRGGTGESLGGKKRVGRRNLENKGDSWNRAREKLALLGVRTS